MTAVVDDHHSDFDRAGTFAAVKDLFAKCHEDGGYFPMLRMARDRYYCLPKLDSPPGRTMTFRGRKVIQWAINNYLGLAERPELIEVATEAAARWGIGAPMGSRFMTGNTDQHEALEAALSRFFAKPSTVLFNYGYLGVLGTVSSLVAKEDIIVIDRQSHASMMDAAFSSHRFLPFRHNDLESLERSLKRASRDCRGGILVMVEGVYGMTGDLADLPGIIALKDRYGARLFVDDAHGVGSIGPGGRGTGVHLGVQQGVDISFGTFAKAFAAIGGFACADEPVTEYIRYNARSQIFAKSLPLVVVAVLLKALEIIEREPELVERLWSNARKLQHGLRELGFELGNTQSAITPVYLPLDGVDAAMKIVSKMRDEKGVFISAVMYPVVPMGVVLCRLVPSASHTDEDIALTLKAFAEARDELGVGTVFPSSWTGSAAHQGET